MLDRLAGQSATTVATILGAAVIVLVLIVAGLFGWLWVGLLGLVILVVATRIDLFGEHAIPGTHDGAPSVDIMARQLEERAKRSPVERQAAAAERAQRQRTLALVKAIGWAVTAFGFGMLFAQNM